MRNNLRYYSRGAAWLLAAAMAVTGAAAATVTTFTGGDPGEGLDLEGHFTYAVNAGPNGAAGQVGDAFFTASDVTGVTLTALNQIGPGGWLAASYGDTENDNNLESVMNSIRWAAAPSVVTVTLRVEEGIDYKLQILEGENCCPGRGFNVVIDGVTEVTDFLPGVVQAGEFGFFEDQKNIVGAVITHEFTASSSTFTFVLDGPGAQSIDITDRNSILNGFTLERLSPFTDVDEDELRDDWEILYFNSLAETNEGDPDGDDLSNLEEQTLATNPNSLDSDGDGLDDGAEANTHQTDPISPDTDDDGLSDGDELNRYATNPAEADSDADAFEDFEEITLLTNPSDADSQPNATVVAQFTGTEPGEGLDLAGNFIYAIDAGPAGVLGGFVGEALFVEELFAFPATLTSQHKAAGWNVGINYGDAPDEFTLAEIMASISWSDANNATGEVTVEFPDLEEGALYKAQLLFAEQAWPRGFDVLVNGAHVANDFSPAYFQSGGFPLTYPDDRGVVLTHTFVAQAGATRFVLDGGTTTDPRFTDRNAILNAATLELVEAAADSDGDGLSDHWETLYLGDLAQDSAADPDEDGASNSEEWAAGTNPALADSDGDGLNDQAEADAGTNPNARDSDFDGLADAAETETDPLNRDSDTDGWSDGDEVAQGRDPNRSETGALVHPFTGADEGEGLDLSGNFIYAFSLGTEIGAGPVRDANFTGQTVAGVTIQQAPNAIEAWYVPDFGATFDDDFLELAIGSIRHGGGGALITLDNLVPGTHYKLQMLFGEQCCPRAMDVFVNGRMIADEFAPFIVQGGANNLKQAAAITYSFFAQSDSAVIETAGATVTTPRYTDRNPAMNAVTLEAVAAPEDSDGDALQDAWENLHFGSLDPAAADDPDGEGLSNEIEFQVGSDPNFADASQDSDADGITDLDEVNTHGTNPASSDTDGDGLADGDELDLHGTNPAEPDSDGDGVVDGEELAFGTDPTRAQPATEFTNILVDFFFGGDPSEGLDLEGDFAHAYNFGSGVDAGLVGDADFKAPVPELGVVLTAQNANANWYPVVFGDTPADLALGQAVNSIAWSVAPQRPMIELDVVPGSRYKLQLLFGEACCDNRGFNVVIDGQVVAENFQPGFVQGGAGIGWSGAQVAAEVATERNKLVIVLDGPGASSPDITDRNAIINALTLEVLELGEIIENPRISAISLEADAIVVDIESTSGRTYILEYKASLDDASWIEASTVTADGAATTLRDENADHRSGATGFWRVRVQ